MKAELRYLYSPNVYDIAGYQPSDPDNFGIFVQAMIGPAGDTCEESFDFMICAPAWLSSRETPVILGEHHLIVQRFDYAQIEAFVRDFCARCSGETWDDVAHCLAPLGRHEFANYKEWQEDD